ncbi:PilZ domain-containing protein [Marinobacter sp. R17]|uniref:PilZ domain-containing protein n=1 Tax=Marinobacter sp. R17 TaxID=2484250 RepID=UPI000F4C84EE|nr:PilZ domain-containing protein [Marinobacter sp. R17]ROU00621.1 PilZ domain-containing protein [Marinobacter sp. R17]
MSQSTERRRFERILFDAPCDIHAGEDVWHSEVLDISMKGVLVRRPENWTAKLKHPFEITIHLNDLDSGIVMDVALRHVEGDHLGFQCQYIDLDSASHLKRLVELNLGDPSLLDRELRHLIERD